MAIAVGTKVRGHWGPMFPQFYGIVVGQDENGNYVAKDKEGQEHYFLAHELKVPDEPAPWLQCPPIGLYFENDNDVPDSWYWQNGKV